MIAVIKGVPYQILFVDEVDQEDSDGNVDHPSKKNPQLQIAKDLSKLDLVETIIHEVLHVNCWELSEECVTEAAKDAARLIATLGVLNGQQDLPE